jgi:hypothetical protein
VCQCDSQNNYTQYSSMQHNETQQFSKCEPMCNTKCVIQNVMISVTIVLVGTALLKQCIEDDISLKISNIKLNMNNICNLTKLTI